MRGSTTATSPPFTSKLRWSPTSFSRQSTRAPARLFTLAAAVVCEPGTPALQIGPDLRTNIDAKGLAGVFQNVSRTFVSFAEAYTHVSKYEWRRSGVVIHERRLSARRTPGSERHSQTGSRCSDTFRCTTGSRCCISGSSPDGHPCLPFSRHRDKSPKRL
jgi:hypothetical protein